MKRELVRRDERQKALSWQPVERRTTEGSGSRPRRSAMAGRERIRLRRSRCAAPARRQHRQARAARGRPSCRHCAAESNAAGLTARASAYERQKAGALATAATNRSGAVEGGEQRAEAAHRPAEHGEPASRRAGRAAASTVGEVARAACRAGRPRRCGCQ